MTLEQIQSMWKEDSVIDQIDLDKASLQTPSLQAKYLELLNEKRLSLKSYEVKYNQLLKTKWMWYTDKLSKEEIDDLGWSYDPFDGYNKPLKSDYSYYFNADKDLSDLKLKVEYLTECVDTLKEILNIITWRHQSIKNAIDWLKFTNPAG